ncbi:IS630 family transposase [Myxococcus sp. MxC21-1]|uniref:IS630 family transposase n=1 Tax=Myxococcus sp. MxC21-1 TaxID=3041439 RepID=UPI0039773B8E
MGRGASCRATAKALECATSTVVVAVRRYQEGGRQGLRDRREGNVNPKVGRDWCLPGQRRVVVTPGNNQKRYLAGALNTRTGQLTWVEGRSKASALFIQLLWRLASQYRRARRIHLVLDNASVHSSKKTLKALAHFGGRFVFHFLPPYCPQGNRIERVWLDLHANVTRNHRCRTMAQLMVRVHAYLSARNAQRSASPSLRRVDLRRTP